MNKEEYLTRLQYCISQLPPVEAQNTMQYYREYFDDAGITEDMVVPESVGTPEQITMRLKKSINSGENITSENINIGGTYNRDNTSGSYNTKQNTGNSYNNSQNAGQYSYNNSQNTAQYEYNNAGQYNKKNDERAIKIIVAIIIAAVTFPIWSGILGVIIGIVFGLGGTIIGLGVAGISLIVVAIVSGYGFATSVLLMGIGLILFGVAILLVIPEALFCIKFLPWLFKQVAELIHKITGRKEFNV